MLGYRERRRPVKVQLGSHRSNQADERLASPVERKAGVRSKDSQQDTAPQNEQISKPFENDSATPVKCATLLFCGTQKGTGHRFTTTIWR